MSKDIYCDNLYATSSVKTPALSGSDTLAGITGQDAVATTDAGGTAYLIGGAGGSASGAGGVASVTGGAATAGNSAGGAATMTGGLGFGSSAGGAVTLTGGVAGATGTGGAVSMTGGAGVAGVGGAASVTGGLGVGTTNAGGAAAVTGGAGASGASTGGAASLTGGVSGAAGTGGAASLVGGAVLSGAGTGGAASLTGGAGTATGTAGSAAIDAGASSGGTGGIIKIGDSNAIATYMNRGCLKAVQVGLNLTALGTSQSSAPTSAQLLGGFLTQTGATGAGAITLPTGTALSAACARTPATGDSFQCVFANLGGGQTLTVTGASGTTVISGGAIATAKTAILTFICTGSNAWSIAVAGG